ncbi:MAG: FtsW/RodA/SpoVE family cell cycle protein [Lachnospiraceae bacterium]|nr:FtsW/RodA/SpoVE family cell cycle protein [Lachnospiraceae bacterium]
MTNLIVELSKYALILLMALYTCMTFISFRMKSRKSSDFMLTEMTFVMLILQFVAYMVLYLKLGEQEELVYYYGFQALFLLLITLLWRLFYKNIHGTLLSNMCMLINIGFIMLTRIDIEKSVRQFKIVIIAMLISMLVPVIIRKWKSCCKFDTFYGILGLIMLGAVLILSATTYGANISFTIAGVTLQPSEFVKILFVFYVAGRFARSTEFKDVVVTTIFAAVHVLILVASTDLGGALLFFVTYLVMIYVATKKAIYCAAGLGAGALAGVLAYQLFSHVRVRVMAWSDPWSCIDNEGYQVAQSLFAIGTGGWTGMGLGQGLPSSIPFVEKDSIFSAISEELGGIFAICVILICMCIFLSFFNLAMKVKNEFYRYIAMGLGTMYATQVLLTVGGVTKFIPLTGVTLPLVSYGGSSILSTLIILGIIQGISLIIHDEEREVEKERERIERAKRNKEKEKQEA